MANVLVGTDLLLVVWNWCVLRFILVDPFSPELLVPVDSVW